MHHETHNRGGGPERFEFLAPRFVVVPGRPSTKAGRVRRDYSGYALPRSLLLT